MNPDVVAGISTLDREGILSQQQVAVLRPIAEGRRLSVHYELRFLLYVGVLLLTAGVGALIEQNLDDISPVAIAFGIGIAAASCLAWVQRKAPSFSWGSAASTHLAFDYVLLLGVLLASADIAYVEAQFTPLGEHWSWHLFWMSLFMAGLALRYDSRVVFSLALSTFAAWRGISASTLGGNLLWSPGTTRTNAIICGVVFVLLGLALLYWNKKEHFEPVASFAGWLLVLSSLFSGSFGVYGPSFRIALLLAGGGLAVYAFSRLHFWLFVMGVLGAYAGMSIIAVEALHGEITISMWFFVTSLASLFGLTRAYRIFSEATS
ncbi:MAG TPA: DUF2157 domain-containing protein [Vicinamibacteria bacterium]|nr:DUF2157 domain-containing protein [Vicinamibacteria bacterium]